MKIPAPAHGPYSHDKSSVNWTMMMVVIALAPATLYGLYTFGWPAVYLLTVTVAASVIFEAWSLWLAGKPIRPFVMDGSALLTGLLLALTLPPWAPWWIGVLGAFFAIVLAKQVFGGIGQNIFNPAMVARVALLITFPLEMTTFVAPKPLFSGDAPDWSAALAITFGGHFDFDAYSSASLLGHLKTETGRGIELSQAMHGHYDAGALALGNIAGSMGETSALMLLAGGLFLIATRVITWHIPAAMIATIALLASIFHFIDPTHYPHAMVHVLSGATLLGAFFIATDMVTSPVTIRGQLLFGAGVGLLTFVIRSWAGYPEGVAFAVILMNSCTPLIDHYLRPRPFGRDRKGQPLQYAPESKS